MNNSIPSFNEYLKQRNIHITIARILVFDSLRINGPVNMSQLVSSLNERVDRATVYRVVKLFEQIGIVNRITIGFKYKLELSEQFSPHHHHLYCLNCHKIIDIKLLEDLENDIRTIANSYEFEIRDHQLEINGYCRDCQKNKDPSKTRIKVGSLTLPKS